ncbi:hypothetical protein HSX37_14420|uniref:Capsule polysaccharide biosynthesis protein n=1 Tax=Dendrosporobacter quercicolus TaxID=146817 RepID=A0A1G9WVT1_9FIRM|nr:hypothetical protein [Dendrosporobacter quercicolus]NSL49227.1 hypothetical protein [Dendrosporobacter quercicolus DSM 1736]SDM88529.1 Capsule polysaccharide biosynthesis protein [Dendrosporobacter quercicolus]
MNCNYAIVLNEALAQRYYDDNVPFFVLTQSELLAPFPHGYLEASIAWYNKTYTAEQMCYYMSLMAKKMESFIPDVIITFTPVPFFKKIFPNALVLHHEYSIYSRLPFPQCWFLDPVGVLENSFINHFQEEIKQIFLDDYQMDMLNQFKAKCNNILVENNPFIKIIESYKQRYKYLILLPLQFSSYYAFDALISKSQYEYLTYVLEAIPSDIGVVVTKHPEYSLISDSAFSFLKTKYANLLYSQEFDQVYASSQYFLPFIDMVVTVSSSVGLQTLLFDNKLITLGKNCFSYISDGQNLKDIHEILEKENEDKSKYLYYFLTRYSIPMDYIYNPGWLSNFLKYSVEYFRKKHKIDFDFYQKISCSTEIFKYLSLRLEENRQFIPQVFEKRSTQKSEQQNTSLYWKNGANYEQVLIELTRMHEQIRSLKQQLEIQSEFIKEYLQNKLKDKKVVFFGSGTAAERIIKQTLISAAYFVDNDSQKWGQVLGERNICSPQELLIENKDKIAIIVASQYYKSISYQLRQMGFKENIHYWSGYDIFLRHLE